MERNKFNLIPVLNEESKQYVVKDFDNVKAIVKGYVEREVDTIGEIGNDLMLACVKKIRTDIRKRQSMISQARITTTRLLIGEFDMQLKEIEAILNEADLVLKEKIDKYKEPVARPKIITLVCKSYDNTNIEKIKEYATSLGVAVEVK